MIIQKQDESYVLLISENDADKLTLQGIYDFLKAEKPDARHNFKIQRGWESPYHYFAEVKKDELAISSGSETVEGKMRQFL